jgi:hypothetical protein
MSKEYIKTSETELKISETIVNTYEEVYKLDDLNIRKKNLEEELVKINALIAKATELGVKTQEQVEAERPEIIEAEPIAEE